MVLDKDVDDSNDGNNAISSMSDLLSFSAAEFNKRKPFLDVSGRPFRRTPSAGNWKKRPLVELSAYENRPFPSYLKPLFQSEAWCTIIHMKMSLSCMWMKSHFHMKGWAPRLALRKRLKVYFSHSGHPRKIWRMCAYRRVTLAGVNYMFYWVSKNSNLNS